MTFAPSLMQTGRRSRSLRGETRSTHVSWLMGSLADTLIFYDRLKRIAPVPALRMPDV